MAELKGSYKEDFNKVKKYIEKTSAKSSEREDALEGLFQIYLEAQENEEGIFAVHRNSSEEYAKEICESLPEKKKADKKFIFLILAAAIIVALIFGICLFEKPEEAEKISTYDIYGEKDAYLFEDQLMLDVTFENTGNTTLHLSFDTEIWDYNNGTWSLWLNKGNYSGGTQEVLPHETTNFFNSFDFAELISGSGMTFDNNLFKIRREVFRYNGSGEKESLGFAEWIFNIETYSGMVAFGDFGTKFTPDQSLMPKEVVFANEEQKEYCEELIDGINYEKLIRFYAESFPNDNICTAGISRGNAIKIIEKLKKIELLTCEPKNPNTGGGYSFYIETMDENIAISSNGGFFIIYIEGEPYGYAFDAESCNNEFGAMWKIAEEILAEYIVPVEEEEANPAIGHDIYAFVSNEFEGGGKYFPDDSVLPEGIEWGDSKTADIFKKTIASLHAGNIKSFMAAFTPAGGSGRTVTIGGNQADELLKLLRKVEIVPGKPQNPATTGGFVFHIVTNDNDYITISSDLNTLRISMKGQKTNYFFNATDYSDEIWNIMLKMDELINNEKDIGQVGSTTVGSHLIPDDVESFVTLFSNAYKTAVIDYAVVSELRDLLALRNLTINPDETDATVLGNPLSKVDFIEFIREDDGSKYSLELYEKGFILKGSAVPEEKRGQQWIVEDDTWEYFINKINTEFEKSDSKIPYWFGLVSPKRVKEVVVFAENGEKHSYTQKEDTFDNFFGIFKSDIKVYSIKERFEGNKMPNPVTEKFIRIKIYFTTGTVYEIIAEENYITMVSSDMNYGLRYNLDEKADAYDAFLDYAEGGPINAVTG